VNYQNWFNSVIAPKKDNLSVGTIEHLNQVWELKFDEEKDWSIPSKIKDRVDTWKEFRYDSENNPRGRWSTHDKEMGDLYTWVLKRKKDHSFMGVILDQFSEQEIEELKAEGFPINETDTEQWLKNHSRTTGQRRFLTKTLPLPQKTNPYGTKMPRM
jgi:hypothetical protein